MKFVKQPGMTLIELTFTFALSSIIALMLYKVFIATQTGSSTLRKINTLQSTRALVHYHMQRDFEGLLLSSPFDAWYETSIALQKKKEGETQEKNDTDKKSEDKKKEAQKKYDTLCQFFPINKNNEGVIEISLATTNSVLTKSSHPCRTSVTYQFVRIKGSKKPLYSLIRTEKPFTFAKAEKKESEKTPYGYTLIDRIENPVITWYMPKMDPKEFVDKKPEEIQNLIAKWIEHPVFETKKELAAPTPDTFFEQPFMPYACIIEGEILSSDDSRHLPFTYAFLYPNGYFTLYSWAMMVVKKQEKDKKKSPQIPPGDSGGGTGGGDSNAGGGGGSGGGANDKKDNPEGNNEKK